MLTAEETGRRLYAFITRQLDGLQVEEWNELLEQPLEQKEEVVFELFTLRSFMVDFIAYSLIPEPELRSGLLEPLFTEVREYAEKRWEEGGQGLEQRLQLYAHALQQRPDEPDLAILSMFCRLCRRSDDTFKAIVPALLLRYLKDVRGTLTDSASLQ